MKIEDIKRMAQAWNQVQEASYGKTKEAMDPVDKSELKGKHKDRKDKDINNDGKADSTDKYLHKRRKAVSKAIKGKESETEVQTQESVEKITEDNKIHTVDIDHTGEHDANAKRHNISLAPHSQGAYAVGKKKDLQKYLAKHYDKPEDAKVIHPEIHESVEDMDEGSIKGSGTDRKAKLKKAYRAGERQTRAFSKRMDYPTPKNRGDEGLKKAFRGGTKAGDGSPTPTGAKRSKSQDSLSGTEHDRSDISPIGKSFRHTHSRKSYAIAQSNLNNKFRKESVEEITEDNKIHTVDIDHMGGHDANASRHNISLAKHRHGTYAVGKKKDLQKYLVKHYDSHEDAKAIHPNVYESKDHGNMNNGSASGEGLSPSAKKELARTTPMPDAVNEPAVDKKTFDAIRASGKKAPMRSNDNAAGEKNIKK